MHMPAIETASITTLMTVAAASAARAAAVAEAPSTEARAWAIASKMLISAGSATTAVAAVAATAIAAAAAAAAGITAAATATAATLAGSQGVTTTNPSAPQMASSETRIAPAPLTVATTAFEMSRTRITQMATSAASPDGWLSATRPFFFCCFGFLIRPPWPRQPRQPRHRWHQHCQRFWRPRGLLQPSRFHRCPIRFHRCPPHFHCWACRFRRRRQ
mmetsp:Transcript_6078/g.14668  ORF Transcript_6078/g.14668 Transcript_6078/m.14668 type:complete len:217 (+) Transcript_6078:225-875(+)